MAKPGTSWIWHAGPAGCYATEQLPCRRGRTYRAGSRRAEQFAKGTSEDPGGAWKNHGRSRREAFVSEEKGYLCARVDSVRSYGGGKGDISKRRKKKETHQKTFKNWNAQTEKKHHKKTWAKKALWASLPRGSTQPHGLSVPFAFCVAHGQRVQCWRSGSRRCETRTKLSSGFGEERLRTYEDD